MLLVVDQIRSEDSPETQHHGWHVASVVTLIGVGVSLIGMQAQPSFYLAVVAICAANILLTFRFDDDPGNPPDQAAAWSYFGLQLALAGALAYLFVRQGNFGMQWLILMPIISQARIYLPAWGSIVIALSSLTLIGAHVYALGGWRAVPSSILGIATAVIFVLLFTDIALKEVAAREESEQLRDDLLAANRKLADFAVKAEELAAERERGRLAREIHDSVGHYLTVVHVQLEAAKTMLGRDPEKTRDALEKAQGLTQKGLADIRRSVASLRESPLAGRSLEDALGELVASLDEAGLSARLQTRGEARDLGSKAELTLYRTAQEGLTNTRKHARARRVDVALDYRRDDVVRLEVRDDGEGSADPSGGFGLLGVRERVRQLAGTLEIETAPGQGLTLAVEIPA